MGGQRSRLALVAIAMAAALTTLASIRSLPLLYFQDAVHYFSLAEHVSRGDGYRSAMYLWPDVMQPPLYVLCVAAGVKLGASAITSGIVVCAIAAGLAVVPLAAVHRALWGTRRGVFVACALAAVYPNVATYSLLTLEALFTLLVLSSVAATLRALRTTRARDAALAGVFVGLAFLTRPEAVVTFAALVSAAALFPLRGGGAKTKLALVGALAAATLTLVAPYAAFMHAETGRFDVMPKVTYNRMFADAYDHMIWPPDQAALTARDQRIVYALMPDDATFRILYAFDHPSYDFAAQFPRQGAKSKLHALVGGARAVVIDGVRASGLFHPLTLAVLAFALLAAFRKGGADRASPSPQGALAPSRAAFALTAWVALAHLAPCVLAGDDYQTRFAAPTMALVLPLLSGGAVALADALTARLGPPSWRTLGTFGVGLVLVALDLTLTRHVLRESLSEPERIRQIEEACLRFVPRGARVAADTARCAYLRGGEAVQLPYVESLASFERYLTAHRVDYVILDARTLAKNPSATLRALADPHALPPELEPVGVIDEAGRPIRVLRVGARALHHARLGE